MYRPCYSHRIVTYYNDNHHLPVFDEGKQEYTIEQLVSFLLEDVSNEKVCKAQPTSVEHSCSFLIDLNCVLDVADLRADGCGVWKHKGVRKSYVVIDKSKSILFTTREHPPPDKDIKNNYLCLLTRVYHDLQVVPDFKRMIATLQS